MKGANRLLFASTTTRSDDSHSSATSRLSTTVAATADDQTSSVPASPKHVVIVGGGVGGLALACRLAASFGKPQMPISSLSDRPTPRSELRVTILEKNEIVGGRCGSFNVTVKGHGRFRHERGPSLLLLPDVYRELFEFCGSSAEACGLEVRPCIPAYQVVFDDGQRLNLGYQRRQQDPLSEPEIESRRALDAIESDGATKWDEYLRACEAFLDCGLPNFIEQRLDLATFPAFLAEALRNGARAWPLRPHSSMLSHFFSSIKLRALASFQDLYVGLEPYTNQALPAGGILTSTAPAVFGLLAAIELHPTNARCGVYAPVGGFRAVANSMETLARNLSVSVECGTTVTKITNKGVYAIDTKKAENDTGSKAAAQFVPADLIVCNADLPYVQESLLKESIDPHRIVYDWSTGGSHGRPRYRFSSGVIAFHWAIDRELTDLNTHNVFLVASSSEQAEQSWKVLRDHDDLLHNAPPVSLAEPFNFYVHRASKTDQTAAPKGHDVILVLVPCEPLVRLKDPHSRAEAMKRHAEQFNEDRIASVRQLVLERLSVVESLQDLKSSILHEVVDTPATYADQYHVAAGSPFGLSHGLGQLSLFRPGPRVISSIGIADASDSPSSSNSGSRVLCVGASSRPGNGVPLVLIGAKLTAEIATRELRRLSV